MGEVILIGYCNSCGVDPSGKQLILDRCLHAGSLVLKLFKHTKQLTLLPDNVREGDVVFSKSSSFCLVISFPRSFYFIYVSGRLIGMTTSLF